MKNIEFVKNVKLISDIPKLVEQLSIVPSRVPSALSDGRTGTISKFRRVTPSRT